MEGILGIASVRVDNCDLIFFVVFILFSFLLFIKRLGIFKGDSGGDFSWKLLLLLRLVRNLDIVVKKFFIIV